jgi:hypothetical protein
LAQLVARLHGTQKVRSSTLLGSTTLTSVPRLRRVTRIRIDRNTGQVTRTTEDLPAAGFAERVAYLQATAPAGMADAPIRFAGVRCDGCGTSAPVDYDRPQLPRGWTSTSGGDFCPACSTQN